VMVLADGFAWSGQTYDSPSRSPSLSPAPSGMARASLASGIKRIVRRSRSDVRPEQGRGRLLLLCEHGRNFRLNYRQSNADDGRVILFPRCLCSELTTFIAPVTSAKLSSGAMATLGGGPTTLAGTGSSAIDARGSASHFDDRDSVRQWGLAHHRDPVFQHHFAVISRRPRSRLGPRMRKNDPASDVECYGQDRHRRAHGESSVPIGTLRSDRKTDQTATFGQASGP
jgi:hypothetical protein